MPEAYRMQVDTARLTGESHCRGLLVFYATRGVHPDRTDADNQPFERTPRGPFATVRTC
ncbi:hypothetical protein [Kibdelosporangium philippinense]|uniref:hypothetical protein n=1 Tax=Kibdelosporangium philippinense TaxID=211113 RepID=UPI00361D7789